MNVAAVSCYYVGTLMTAKYIAVMRMDTMIIALYFYTVLLVGVQTIVIC